MNPITKTRKTPRVVTWSIGISLVLLAGLHAGEQESPSAVHIVGIYEASPNQHSASIDPWGRDLKWPKIGEVLIEQAKAVSASPGKRVWELLPEAARAVAANKRLLDSIRAHLAKPEIPPGVETTRGILALTGALTDVLQRRDFYDAECFAHVSLDDQSKELLKRHKELSVLELCVLNRRLFEASFPDAVIKNPFRLDKATVSVRVTATKEPITLVLCSHNSVRWHVRPDKDAKLARVIVGGYYVQDVVGTEAPVTYCVHDKPQRPNKAPTYFYAYKEDSENYPKLVEAVRQLTGKQIDSFQGRYSYEGGPPFVVGGK